jgi:1,4-alpha-glucan branching enzyme
MPVYFEFIHPTAAAVMIAGSFNHWHPASKPMKSAGDGRWWKETAMLPGTYEYCLVVDGVWMPDPSARESVANPYGGRNSLLTVAASPEAGHLADAENLPLENVNQEK